jgi:hypothetical protein
MSFFEDHYVGRTLDVAFCTQCGPTKGFYPLSLMRQENDLGCPRCSLIMVGRAAITIARGGER